MFAMCPKYSNIAQTEGGVPNNGYGQTFPSEFHLLYCILSSRAKKDPSSAPNNLGGKMGVDLSPLKYS